MKKNAIVSFIILALLMTSSFVLAQPSPSKVGTTDTNYGINYNNGPCIDRAPNGQVVCIWATGDNHSKAVLWSSYDELFGVWNTPQSIGNGNGDRTTPALVADDNSHFHATWSDDYKLVYSQYDGASWSEPVQVYNDTMNANKNSIVVGSDGKIWIAWSTYRENDNVNEWLMAASSSDNGATWSNPDTLAKNMHPGIVSSYFCIPFLAAGPDGKIGVSYREKDTNISALYQVYFQEYDGGTWSEPELITTFSDSVDCYQASIAYDIQGRLQCVFYTDEVDWPSADMGQIYYTWKDAGGVWSDPVAITSEPTGKADYPAISIGPNNAFYVVYLQNSYTSGEGLLQVFTVTSDDRGATWSDTIRVSDGTLNLDLRSVSIGKHPQMAGIGGTSFEGGADLLWVQPDTNEVDGYALYYGRIPWVTVTGIESFSDNSAPMAYDLAQNYPNPFNPTTSIAFKIMEKGNVTLEIYNMVGQRVATLVDKEMTAGSYRVHFDASKLSSGVYFYKMTSNNFVATKKMLLVR